MVSLKGNAKYKCFFCWRFELKQAGQEFPDYDKTYMSRDMTFPTMWSVRPAKPQTSLRIRAD